MDKKMKLLMVKILVSAFYEAEVFKYFNLKRTSKVKNKLNMDLLSKAKLKVAITTGLNVGKDDVLTRSIRSLKHEGLAE